MTKASSLESYLTIKVMMDFWTSRQMERLKITIEANLSSFGGQMIAANLVWKIVILGTLMCLYALSLT